VIQTYVWPANDLSHQLDQVDQSAGDVKPSATESGGGGQGSVACRPRTAHSVLLALYRGPGVRSTEKAADPMHRAITQLFERIRQFLDEVMPEFSARDICFSDREPLRDTLSNPRRSGEILSRESCRVLRRCCQLSPQLRRYATVLDLLSTCYLLPLEGLRC